jgi:hypothetical protein
MPKHTKRQTPLPPLPTELLSPEDALALEAKLKSEPAPTPVAVMPGGDTETPSLRASIVNLQSELQNRTRERDNFKLALDRTKFLLGALERSYGLAAASQVVEVPNDGMSGGSVIDRFNAMAEGPAKTEFYQAHKTALLEHINQGVPSPNSSLPEAYRW